MPEELFSDPNKPLHLDIGSARGQFLIELSEIDQDWNLLGLEIRNALVISANRDVRRRRLENVQFLFCNANISLQTWLSCLQVGILQRVSIQFPDPWFKRRHHKRRVLQKPLLLSIAMAMSPGAELFVQSDFHGVIQPMVELIEETSLFNTHLKNDQIWLEKNPYLISTEREKYVVKKKLFVYRALYYRNHNIVSAIN
tara:strand:+ start:915 stop:1508 length:594 start_codon:yes stop_codon:yes gene_type:complete